MENIISKINKILELARRGGTESESQTAKKMADEMAAKYNMLIAEIEIQAEDGDYMFEGSMTGTSRSSWQDAVYVAISKLYDCMYYKREKDDGTSIKTIVGKLTNVEIAKTIAAHVVLIAIMLGKEWSEDESKLRSFKRGYAAKIWSRVNHELLSSNRTAIEDSIPDMKKASAQAAAELKEDGAEEVRKRREDGIDRRSYNKGASVADHVSLNLSGFLNKDEPK